MTDDPEALRRLEERVAALETELRELRARAWLGAGPRPAALRPPADVPPARSVAPNAAPVRAPGVEQPRPVLTPLPATTRTTDLEQWFGQRGLLLVGVVALIAAGGFFLKYAFDRGWIAPWLRVMGALAAGTGVALLGERQIARNLKRYGAGLIGAGAGLAYLGVWAAAGPYTLVPRELGAPLLAALTAVVAWRAAVHRVEVLATLAVAGAFLAPVFLPAEQPSLVMFLVYLEIVGAAAAELALRTGWGSLFTVTLIGYLVLPVVLAGSHLGAPAGYLHGVLGGVGTLIFTARRGWSELRLAGLLGAWLFLIAATAQDLGDGDALPLAASGALALAAWVHDRRRPAVEQALSTRWASAFTVTLIGYFVLPVVRAGTLLHAPETYVYVVLGGVGTLIVAARRGWSELRLAGLIGAWLLLVAAAVQSLGNRDALPLAAAGALALVAWVHDRHLPLAEARGFTLPPTPDEAFASDRLSLLTSPLAFAVIATMIVPDVIRPYHGVPVAALAILYAAAGWKPRSAALMAVSAGLLAIAIAQAWDGAAVTALWMALVLACVAVDRRFDQQGLRPVAVAVAWLAGFHQMISLAALPVDSAAALTDTWARTLYVCVAGSALAALLWRPLPGDTPDDSRLVHPDALWALSALLLFVGVSVIIRRFFGAHAGDWAGAVLAGRLALSVWWLIYAAGAVQIGFALNLKGVRSVGLAVAAVAALKIGLYDLSNLEALYRVGAFFGLALVALAVAYLYSRRARTVGGG